MRLFLQSLTAMACLCASVSWAQEQARVISSTPTWVPSNTVNSQGEVVMYTAFNVVYEFAGKTYSVQLPNDPGPYVTLQITPTYSASTPPATFAACTSSDLCATPNAGVDQSCLCAALFATLLLQPSSAIHL